jgi:hypothetical protein
MKVSWYVYAERNDKFVQEYPFSKSVEMEKKPHEKGKYLRPELYGQPEEKGIFFQYKASPILQATPNTQPVLKEKTTENFKIDK